MERMWLIGWHYVRTVGGSYERGVFALAREAASECPFVRHAFESFHLPTQRWSLDMKSFAR